MVRWCIQLMRLTQVLQTRLFGLAAQNRLSVSSSFKLYFVLLPFFLKTKITHACPMKLPKLACSKLVKTKKVCYGRVSHDLICPSDAIFFFTHSRPFHPTETLFARSGYHWRLKWRWMGQQDKAKLALCGTCSWPSLIFASFFLASLQSLGEMEADSNSCPTSVKTILMPLSNTDWNGVIIWKTRIEEITQP